MKRKLFYGLGVLTLVACNKDEAKIDKDLPDVYHKFYNVTEVYQDGDYVVIETPGIPEHKSPYYSGTEWADERYEAYNGSNTSFNQNPNKIAIQNYTFKIPLNPALNNAHSATPMGAMGVAINGVPFFNQYAAPGDDLTEEINTFDQYNGHPTFDGVYHYHIMPSYLTSVLGSDALLGFLLDGFPVYGPMENGATVTNANLDAYHGHFGVTSDYPDGIYHYHITSEDPYINGDGYYGTPGTVTQ